MHGDVDFMANMGVCTKEQLEWFWLLVGDQLGLSHTFEWTETEPSICLEDRILIRRSLVGKYLWEGYQEILHEVTHAICPWDKGHGRGFHNTLAELIGRFLGYGEGQWQKRDD